MQDNTKRLMKRNPMLRYRGRIAQVGIYFGKMARMFIYQNDWKVLPMAALIAGLVGMVIRGRLFMNKEGTLMGSFAMVCVCIWNGCFNSIQVICRERDVVKREHRSGMHISSYVFSHMLYQAILCGLQTAVTLYVTKLVGVQYPAEGMITSRMMVDYGISMFLITYASDMMALWISSITHTTTAAMTIMPFVLIFQLVFSGGMLTLPDWTKLITPLTISNPGLKVLTAQADYNDQPVVTLWDQVVKMKNKEINLTVTLGQVMDFLNRNDVKGISEIREKKLIGAYTVGSVIDELASSPVAQPLRNKSISYHSTVGDLLGMIGEDKAKDILENSVKDASYNKDYDDTPGNIISYWLDLGLFVFIFALFTIIALEFIDKDKR